MCVYNLAKLKSIEFNYRTQDNVPVDRLVFPGCVVETPRPGTIGIALFIEATYRHGSANATLHYFNREFQFTEAVDYDHYLKMKPYWDFMVNDGYQYISKPYHGKRQYNGGGPTTQYFYAKQGARTPVDVGGFATMLLAPSLHSPHFQTTLFVTREIICDDMMVDDIPERVIFDSGTEVTSLRNPDSEADMGWWGRQAQKRN